MAAVARSSQARLCFTATGGLRLEQPAVKGDMEEEGFPAVKMEEPVAEEAPKKRARAKSTARCSLEARASPAAAAAAEEGPPMTARERQRQKARWARAKATSTPRHSAAGEQSPRAPSPPAPSSEGPAAEGEEPPKKRAKAKAKSTARRFREAQSSPAPRSEQSMLLSKRTEAPEPKLALDGTSDAILRTPDGKKPPIVIDLESEVKVKQEPKQQLLLNMNTQGSMSLVSGSTKKDKLRGPAIGGNFRRGRQSKKVVARLPEFRSRASMYRAVWEGRYKKTSSGLEKKDLCVSVTGKIVPKRRSEQCRAVATANGWLDHWRDWTSSTKIARDQLGIKSGFVKVKKNGTDEEMALYASIVSHYDQKAGARKNRRRARKAAKEGAGVEKETEAEKESPKETEKETEKDREMQMEAETEKDRATKKEKAMDAASSEVVEAEVAVAEAAAC